MLIRVRVVLAHVRLMLIRVKLVLIRVDPCCLVLMLVYKNRLDHLNGYCILRFILANDVEESST